MVLNDHNLSNTFETFFRGAVYVRF